MQKEKEQSFKFALKRYIFLTLFYIFKIHFSHFKNNAFLKHICSRFFRMFNSNYYNPSVAQLTLINVYTCNYIYILTYIYIHAMHIYIYILYTFIQLYIHTIHTYIHTSSIHTSIRAYVHTSIPPYIHPSMHACIHASIYPSIHGIHTPIHTFIHAHTHG